MPFHLHRKRSLARCPSDRDVRATHTHAGTGPIAAYAHARPPGCDVTEGPFWDDARLSEIILAAWVEIPSVHCTPLKWKLFREERVLYKASVTIGERDTAGV